MSFSIGICGFPNVGKSTLFKLLTQREVKISPIPFSTIEPNVGKVSVPDERLLEIAKIVKPQKITFTQIEFIDVAGLIEGAHKGEGLGNQFLAHLRNCDAILQVVRGFEDEKVPNLMGKIDPKREIEIIKTELLLKDLESVEKIIDKEKKDKEKIKVLEKIKNCLERGIEIQECELLAPEKEKIKSFQFLTSKPKIFLINGPEKLKEKFQKEDFLILDLKMEEEIMALNENEREELKVFSGLDKLIKKCYQTLDLITFYTIAGGKEVRAFTLKRENKIEEAGRKVHSDFSKFIKAEVLPFEEFVKIKDWKLARETGKIKVVGKDYIVKDGDIIEFKI